MRRINLKKWLLFIMRMLNVIPYTTTAPTAANSSGLRVAVLASEPATKYDGWIYFITE